MSHSVPLLEELYQRIWRIREGARCTYEQLVPAACYLIYPPRKVRPGTIMLMRPRHSWRLRSRSIELGARTLIMGIVNVTPDSFSDGGLYIAPSDAVDHALRLLEQGADILDIGGESTRPGARVSPGAGGDTATVSTDEETRRVLPVIEQVKRRAPTSLLSVDTYKAEVARRAIEAGAEIVNDVSALRWDPAMPKIVGEFGCGVVLMHMRGRPEEWRTLPPLANNEVVPLVLRELREWAAAAEDSGIARASIVLDPGYGFGKSFEENYPLLAHLDELHALGYPIMAGTSRKSFIGKTVGGSTQTEGAPHLPGLGRCGSILVPPSARLHGTLASETAAILKGAHILRVHDVIAAREAAAVADAILNASLFTAEGAEGR
jgi:dihydropteroate synthase